MIETLLKNRQLELMGLLLFVSWYFPSILPCHSSKDQKAISIQAVFADFDHHNCWRNNGCDHIATKSSSYDGASRWICSGMVAKFL